MYLAGDRLPAVTETSLLGVRIRDVIFNQVAQLHDRLDHASQAMPGLDQIGALRTPSLSPAKKKLIIFAYGQSRVEYVLADVRPCCLCLCMASCPQRLVPQSGMLRVPIISRLRYLMNNRQLNVLAVRCYLAASTDRSSCLLELVARCPFYTLSLAFGQARNRPATSRLGATRIPI